MSKTKQELIMLRGLPASGKSTFAKKWVTEGPNRVRVNKDDLRSMIGYERYKEKIVIDAHRSIISEALANGYSIIVDDTNFNFLHEQWLRSAVKFCSLGDCDVEFSIVNIKCSLDECIRRDSTRELPYKVGANVIIAMYEKYCMVDEVKEQVEKS